MTQRICFRAHRSGEPVVVLLSDKPNAGDRLKILDADGVRFIGHETLRKMTVKLPKNKTSAALAMARQHLGATPFKVLDKIFNSTSSYQSTCECGNPRRHRMEGCEQCKELDRRFLHTSETRRHNDPKPESFYKEQTHD